VVVTDVEDVVRDHHQQLRPAILNRRHDRGIQRRERPAQVTGAERQECIDEVGEEPVGLVHVHGRVEPHGKRAKLDTGFAVRPKLGRLSRGSERPAHERRIDGGGVAGRPGQDP
jgi:hypothetical protein